jgi:heterodisulfide reductase subunit A-like polyferredoxin
MRDRAAGIGAVLCTCGGKLFSSEEIETIGSRVSERGGNSPGVLVRDYLCLKKQLASTAQWARNKGLAGIVFAGCSPVRSESLMHAISQKTGIPSGNMRGVDVSGVRPGSRQKMESTLGAIDRQYALCRWFPDSRRATYLSTRRC